MRKAVWLIALTMMTSATGARAASSLYADDLGKCLVAKTSDADKTELVRWVFVAMSAHPAVAKLANVSQSDRDASNRTLAALFDRLLTIDCRPVAVTALKYEGADSLKVSFGVLGQVAVGGIFNHPAVDREMSSFAEKVDMDKFTALMLEAGINGPTAPAKQK